MPYKIEINDENREIFLNILKFYFEEGKNRKCAGNRK